MPADFRQYQFPHDHARLADVRGLGPYGYGTVARNEATCTGGLVRGWTPLYRTPRSGSRVCGENRLSRRFCRVADVGKSRVHAIRAASLSPRGYQLVCAMMRINGFLGEVVGLQSIMNEYSYNFALYGDPHPVAPWGWQLYGHHCAVHCMLVEGRMVLSPVFLGAEPNEIDAGPYSGTTAFVERIALAAALMAALPEVQREEATVYEQMVDPAMPPAGPRAARLREIREYLHDTCFAGCFWTTTPRSHLTSTRCCVLRTAMTMAAPMCRHGNRFRTPGRSSTGCRGTVDRSCGSIWLRDRMP